MSPRKMRTGRVVRRGKGRVIEIGEYSSIRPMCPSVTQAQQVEDCYVCLCVSCTSGERRGHMPWLFQCESKIDSRGRGALGPLPDSAHKETHTHKSSL